MDFYSAYAQGFARVAAVTLPVTLADPAANATTLLEQARACHEESVAVAVFPELCLTGYTCGDLFLQQPLLRGAEEGLRAVLAASEGLNLVTLAGLPVRAGGKLYNCAAVVCGGRLDGRPGRASQAQEPQFDRPPAQRIPEPHPIHEDQ